MKTNPIDHNPWLGAIMGLATEVAETVRVLSEHESHRQQVKAWEAIELERIRETSAIIRQNLDAVMSERDRVMATLLEGIGSAVENRDLDALTSLLGQIDSTLSRNPLASLANLDQVAAQLADPDQVWDLGGAGDPRGATR